MRRTLLFVLLLLALLSPQAALADGDPGSDVLLYQSLFLGSDAGVSATEQVQLGRLLQAAQRAGFPIRVAIIAGRSDLGAITGLWGQPRAYARFLGLELSLAYQGRLLVVMPDGLGFNWPGHSSAAAYADLGRIRSGASGPALASATSRAVATLAAAAHVDLHRVAPESASAGGKSVPAPPAGVPAAHTSTRVLAFVALFLVAGLILVSRFWLFPRRARLVSRGRAVLARPHLPPVRRPVLFAGLALLLPAAAVAAVVAASPSATPANSAVLSNPVLDPGTPESRPAPPFTLTDQFGRAVALSRFHGKVVILAFSDSECTTLCPLTTTAMLDAKAMLGSAGKQVQLVGVDANPRATAIEDVLSYSQLHGMLHSWEFLTSSPTRLKRVWHSYSIGVDITRNLVDHTPAIFVIDPHGRLVRLYLTWQSYAAVDQLGQLLASEAARLLPSHPAVDSHLSYARIPGISPTAIADVHTPGGGKITLGPGHARLLLFFATWNRQTTGLAGGLLRLGGYERLAARSGLPRLAAIDEGAVEPTGALARFLQTFPGRLPYPIGIDTSGRLADGYEVAGQPWLMLVDRTGHIDWTDSIAGVNWPTTKQLVQTVRLALARPATTTPPATLAGSPPALAAIHRQASRMLGGYQALAARIRRLHGYPIVLNVWASWCTPCRAEFNLFAAAAAHFGHRVAFLGADSDDSAPDAQAFLDQHPVSYPSYSVGISQLTPLAVIEGRPTTIYIDAAGKVVNVHTGPYEAQGLLDADIEAYARPAR